jgi:hypothetical protein
MGCLMPETDRDLKGYGRKRPFADWPGGARVAVSFVLNYEEGGERSVADGDAQAENYLVPEVVGLPASPVRSRNVEDLFEYGSRRILAGLTAIRRTQPALYLMGDRARAQAQSRGGTGDGRSGPRGRQP